MSDLFSYYAIAVPVGLLGAFFLWTKLRPEPKFRLRVPDVVFPLNLINFVDGLLRTVGIVPFRVKRQQFIEHAKRIAQKSDRRVFGDQDELVRGVEHFVNGVSESCMSASGILLLNGFLDRVLKTRETVTEYINEHADQVLQAPLVKPIIISGLPRTGSTMLYNLMACDPLCRAPRFFEMSQMSSPVPPCERANLDTDERIAAVMARFDEVEKLYPHMFTEAGKSHRSHPSELEEELLILFQAMVLQIHVPLPIKPEFREWFERDDNKAAAYRYMRVFLQMMNSCWQPESHWVLKAPVHSYYLDEVARQFPDARMVFTHRDPLNVVPSWATLIESYLGWSFQQQWLDRVAFGRYIVDSLKLMFERTASFVDRTDPAKCFNVNYEVFVKDPVAMVERIYAHFGMEVSDEFRDAMREWIANNRQGKWGRAPYSLANYDLTKEQVLQEFAPYIEKFLSK